MTNCGRQCERRQVNNLEKNGQEQIQLKTRIRRMRQRDITLRVLSADVVAGDTA